MDLLIGIDVGTTGSKALLVDKEGKVIQSWTEEYPLYTPYPGWSEQDPEDWWRATKKAIQMILKLSSISPKEIKGIGLTGQMHGSVFLDSQGNVIRRAILWNDQRTAKQCEEIVERVGGVKNLLNLTLNLALTGFTAPKILWLRENEPENYKKVKKVLLPKDYIRYRLTGEYASEVSDASGTLLFDVKNRRWSKEMLSLLDIPEDFMPKVYESPEITGYIKKDVAEELGIPEGTPVVGGGGDQAAQAVGTGVVKSGIVSVTLGTSGVVFAHLDKPEGEKEGRLHTFCHAVPGKWHTMGVMLSAGGSFRWFRDSFGEIEMEISKWTGKDPYEFLSMEAEKASRGSEGLIFLPYLTGERTPYPDPMAKGVFVGITLRHKKPHFVRSVLEGVAFGLRDSLELIKSLGIEIKEIRVSGGGARSPIWRQILADIFNSPIVTINVTEGAAYGAALIAGVGVGIYESVESACDATIKVVSREEPKKENVSAYKELYELYRELYPVMKNYFKKLSLWVEKYHEG
ncbi:MAG: xylulokinase [Dictyoglomaceae bacterium]